ncbi:Trx7/PDZ domain-containing (seleno)protein [Limnoglobus roseus]|uniref:PDZ domain-containing protein n=1 Tax=Limnoglobus roseus TaxID=2598579 RepID=A0A5C1AHR3_9BACT|nr:Trx7/PDZ domain-containing (seleno)protein [Limnoglobus roseus]QEL17192.1 hypothetical protein PX52LOC_04175 [Limnoglobus roseus]
MFRATSTLAFLLAFAASVPAQNPREKKVRDDKVKVEADGYWIYNNYPKAVAEATAANKPIVVVLRCIPCEECVKLDDDLVDKDPVLRPLLDKFVRVRIVSTNGLDLNLFQYDYDQSFAVFLLNADGTIYGRFGTRSHRKEWVGDVSIPGLSKALQGALDLHGRHANVKGALAAKRGPEPLFPTPEVFPTLKAKYGPTLNYERNVVQSCIHCHQVGDAIRDAYRAKGPIPEEVLLPYPHPKAQGLIFDPKEKATVLRVDADSAAAAAGFQAGDEIVAMNDQPLLSLADVQWVLHHTPAKGGKVKAELRRGGKPLTIVWELPAGWRQRDDISWRSGAWSLRRMTTGGMLLEPLTVEERAKASVKDGMALRAQHVGQFGPHAAAKAAGFQVGDVIVSYDGKADLPRETDVLVYGATAHKVSDKVPVKFLRNGKAMELSLPMQP